jgi:uncharacterized OB-fold protein
MIPTHPPGPGPEAQYRAYLAEGRFMIQRSRSTGRYVFYPRVAEPGNGRSDLEWVEASGLGTVYSITVNRTRTGDYNVALVELDEGPRLMTRIEGIETVPIGTRVKARILEIDGEPAVVFDVI